MSRAAGAQRVLRSETVVERERSFSGSVVQVVPLHPPYFAAELHAMPAKVLRDIRGNGVGFAVIVRNARLEETEDSCRLARLWPPLKGDLRSQRSPVWTEL